MTSKKALPHRVPFSATPPGETPEISAWAQHVVWTDRMLSTLLENKVRGGKWHTLIDKVYAPLNLYAAACKVIEKKKGAGIDSQSCEAFAEHLFVETRNLSEEIPTQSNRPSAVRRVHIPKPGRPNETRPLGIPTVRDRVVQKAIVSVIEPILDHQFHERSFVFLGYSFRGEKIYPRRESLAKLKARLGKSTLRARSGSIETICMELTAVLRGWFYYFRHCRWTIFADLDSKIRSRLRRLLLRRHRNNPLRLPRHERWPNDYFAKAALFSLREAHNRFGRSHQGHY